MCVFSRDIVGYVLWCQKGSFSSPVPQVKPRSLSIDMQRLSLEAAMPLPLRPKWVFQKSQKVSLSDISSFLSPDQQDVNGTKMIFLCERQNCIYLILDTQVIQLSNLFL